MAKKEKRGGGEHIRVLASFDLGNATAKIKTASLSTEFRSIAGRLSKSRRFGDIKSLLVFTYNGETLVFGDESRDLIDGEPVAYTDMRRYTDGFYRQLFAAALWRSFHDLADQGIVEPVIVCSIPVSEYADGNADAVKKNIIGAYVIDSVDKAQALTLHVAEENVIIIPEGAGSYYQAILAPGSNLAAREVAVLDIGFYTTDLVIFNKGVYVTGSAHSTKHGVRQVAEEVYRFLRRTAAYEGDLWAVDSALTSGCILVGNDSKNIMAPRDAAYPNLLNDILAFYHSNKGSRTPGAVLLSGGGADGVYPFVPATLRDAGWRVSVHARRANADGGFLYLEQREQAKAGSEAKGVV